MIYEKSEITKWLSEHETSPITGLKIKSDVYECKVLQTQLNEFYDKNPEYIKKRYEKSMLHCDNINEINNAINKKTFSELLKYKEYDWTLFNDGNLKNMLKNIDKKHFEYVIENTKNLECEMTNKKRPIHYVCKYSTVDGIEILLNKNVDLECEDNNKWRPIHYVCRYHGLDAIKLLIDKNVDLECETINKWRPIHYSMSLSGYRCNKIIGR